LIPDARRMALVLDKRTTYEIAAKVGIHVPRMWQVAYPADLDPVVQGISQYPVVLKWPDPGAVTPTLTALGLPLLKCEYAYGQTELEQSLRRYIPAGVFPLIQEFCPGYGLGQMLLMQGGQSRLRFQY